MLGRKWSLEVRRLAAPSSVLATFHEAGSSLANRAFEAIMELGKIDVARIEAAVRDEV